MCVQDRYNLNTCIALLNEIACDGLQLSEIEYLTDALGVSTLYLIVHTACCDTSM
jgi:hypothetical protein